MRRVTVEKESVIDASAASGKIMPVDARHLFILLWSATQFYVEFEALACDALDIDKLVEADYVKAAKTITTAMLRGLLVNTA